jgi:branched-chain amino acid transport system substrate-binding protein
MKRLLACLLAGFWASSSPAQTGQPVTIAGSIDLSGPLAALGEDVLAGIRFAVENVNKNGGVLGRPVQFVHQDNGTNPQRAVSQSTALAETGPAMLISPNSSGSALAVTKTVSLKYKVPMCTTSAGTDGLTMKEFQPYIFAPNPNTFMLMRAVTAYLAKQPYKRYAVIVPDYAGGRETLVRFREFMKELNPQAEIVVETFPKLGATDFTADINKILAAKPDYVWAQIFGNDLLTFGKQAKAVDFFKQINNKFITVLDTTTLKAFGNDAPIGTEGYAFAPYNHMLGTKEGKDFVNQFKVKTGNYPSDWSVMGYECVSIWAQAANAAKSIDAAALMRQIETGKFQSVRTSEITFRASDHQSSAPVYMGKVVASKELGAAVLEVTDIIPATVTRATEDELKKSRGN